MSNQFTPGPWTVSRIDSSAFNIRASEDSVALVYAHQGSPVSMDRHDEGAGNANLIAAAPALCIALSQMNHMGGDERGGYCICPKADGSAPDDQHASSCADARAALRLAGVNIQAAPSVHIKLRPKGKKRFEFLSGNGGLNHLRIHAAMFTPERASVVIAEIKAEHGDKYETKVEAF